MAATDRRQARDCLRFNFVLLIQLTYLFGKQSCDAAPGSLNSCVDSDRDNLVLSYVLANTPMESNGQRWGAWSSLVEMC